MLDERLVLGTIIPACRSSTSGTRRSGWIIQTHALRAIFGINEVIFRAVERLPTCRAKTLVPFDTDAMEGRVASCAPGAVHLHENFAIADFAKRSGQLHRTSLFVGRPDGVKSPLRGRPFRKLRRSGMSVERGRQLYSSCSGRSQAPLGAACV